MKISEVIVFVIYLVFMLGIGVYFFMRGRGGGEKTYFLGDRQMGPWVSALSAGASDMSAWVLMGLPTSIYAFGLGKIWIAVGLAIGYTISWLVEAPRLRRFSIICGDSITIPQYLTNRFLSKSGVLRILCAVVFLIAYTIYSASSMKACGTLFHTVIGMDANHAMYLAAIIIIAYTFLGGFSAVCWTDFFQGMLMLGALLIAPIFAAASLGGVQTAEAFPEHYWNIFPDAATVISGLAWGLGYFGMPHIIIRFMSVRSQTELKKSARIGIIWTLLILTFAGAAGIVGRLFLGYEEQINSNSLVFIAMVRRIFPGVISGILLSAVLAASMSTADSQLLTAASAFASDVYKPVIRKNKVSDGEMLWAGRWVVLAIALISLMIASNPGSGSIMALVENAWGIFGAAFGPTILLSLFWKRFNFEGAVAGIFAGAVTDICWILFLSWTGIYELLPGFVVSLIVAVLVASVTPAPSAAVEKLYDDAAKDME